MRVTGILITCVLLGGGPRLEAAMANAIEAVVHDSPITYQEVMLLNEQTDDIARRRYRDQPETLMKKMGEMREENLEKLMERQLILHEFKTAGYSLPESVIDDMVRDQIRNDFGDRAKMTKTLEEKGITTEKFRQQVRDRFIVQALRAKNVSSEIIISPHKVEAYYMAHHDEFKIEDEVKLRVIVLRPPAEPDAAGVVKLGDEILAKLKEGATFAEMAAVYSQGSQRSQGGDWGWRELSKLTMGLADVAASLPVGKVSGVFSRSAGDDYWIYQYENGQPTSGRHYGTDPTTKKQSLIEERRFENPSAMANLPPPQEFYLMLLEDKRPAHFRPLSDVREEIEKALKSEESDRIEKQWIDRLKKKTFVKRF